MKARLGLYDAVAEETARVVLRRYSTSFGLASRLLSAATRRHIENIYALVRVADELVDGPAADAGLDTLQAGRLLDDLESETVAALATGFSSNLVVHAFARTARETGIDVELTAPFFESMRVDLTEVVHTPESFDRYVYGSAEVVGLMCLRAFLCVGRRRPDPRGRAALYEELEPGARALGAAFQKINFLRDLAADFDSLGRSYFPGVDVATFDEATKVHLLDDIDADLAVAAAVIPRLPAGSRHAVALARGLFSELSRRLRATPADRLRTTRIRVPDPVKLRIAAVAFVGRS